MTIGRIKLQAGRIITHKQAFRDKQAITIYPPKPPEEAYVVQLWQVQSKQTGSNTFSQHRTEETYERYKTLDEVAEHYDIDADVWDVLY